VILGQHFTFPGFMAGLELGNFHKHLALHCDRELLHYLRHIKKIWDFITGNNIEVRRSTNIMTVRILEMLAPATSIIDRNIISVNMKPGGKLFPLITDPLIRTSIEDRILSLGVMIPTIASFHENTNYLRIAVDIIRYHILDNEVQPSTKKTELFEAIGSVYTAQEPVLEIDHNEFSPIVVSNEDRSQMAYVQIFISALRIFSKLGYDSPRKELEMVAERGSLEIAYLVQFLRTSNRLGFQSDTINRVLREQERLPFPLPPTPEEEDLREIYNNNENKKRRWNRPFSKQYREIRSRLFLPNM
jgi:hypothetical protein